MNKLSVFRRSALGVGLAALFTGSARGQTVTLRQAVTMAQTQGYQAQAGIATLDAARSRDRAFAARLWPQLSLSQQATSYIYTRNIQGVPQPDGSTLFLPVEQKTANAGLTVSQRIPLTGSTVSLTSTLQRFDKTGASSLTSFSSAPVTLSLSQPIMRSNGMRWDGKAQDLTIVAAERQYLESREQVASQTSTAFFDFFIAKKSLENATANAATNDTLFTLNKGRLEVGKIGENDLLQSELALLRANSALENAKLEYARTHAAFRLAINAPSDATLDVTVPSDIPLIDPDPAIAEAQALRNRAQMTDYELQEVQARRRVADSRFNNGPGASITASVGLNQTAPGFDSVYKNLLQAQRFSIFVDIPLLQFGVRRAEVQAAKSDERRVAATARAGREQVAQEAHFAALQLSQAKRNVVLTAKADTVAQKRFDVAYNRYVIGKIGVDILYTAQAEKDQAVNQYLQALRNYWAAYYRLRQLTLYDFEAGAPIH